MPKLRNINPLGDVDIVGVGPVKAGEEFEVSDDLAERLLEQPSNYEAVKSALKQK